LHLDGDFLAFANLLRDAQDRLWMRVLGCFLVTIHFHVVLRPDNDGDLNR